MAIQTQPDARAAAIQTKIAALQAELEAHERFQASYPVIPASANTTTSQVNVAAIVARLEAARTPTVGKARRASTTPRIPRDPNTPRSSANVTPDGISLYAAAGLLHPTDPELARLLQTARETQRAWQTVRKMVSAGDQSKAGERDRLHALVAPAWKAYRTAAAEKGAVVGKW